MEKEPSMNHFRACSIVVCLTLALAAAPLVNRSQAAPPAKKKGSYSPPAVTDEKQDQASGSYQTSQGSAMRSGFRQNLEGMLKNKRSLDWPLGLRILPPSMETGPIRREVEFLFQRILKEADSGQSYSGLVKQAKRDIARLRKVLGKQAATLPVTRYTITEARRFLNHLELLLEAL
jgi:hypothetical protein